MLALFAYLGYAQDLTEKVWGIFAYTIHGDSTPDLLPQTKTLTAYGANQLYAAGATFRERYVAIPADDSVATLRVQGLSAYTIDPDEVVTLSTPEQFMVASAQAFVQGLFPPVGQLINATFLEPSSQLANGTIVAFPLDGYQYPQIVTQGYSDPNSISIAGQADCFAHEVAEFEYQVSDQYQQINEETAAFYQNLSANALSSVLETSATDYMNACEISEYLDYQQLHNSSLLDSVSEDDVILARSLADKYVYAVNSNSSSETGINNGNIRSIAGQTLAARILESFVSNVEARGSSDKVTLLFGRPESPVALASLLQLAAPTYSKFQSRPSLGASLVFELFSLSNESYPVYPDSSELFVRFLLHNGTNSSTQFVSYPLFGHGPSNIAIPFDEFLAGMEQISMGSTEEWCLTCNSNSVFCDGLVSSTGSEKSGKSNGMSLAVAGVIGAFVTLAVIGLLAAIGFLVCRGRRQSWRRRSSPGGFKGDRKLASDCDVSFNNPVWGDLKAPADNQPANTGTPGEVATTGHHRSGSWEMGQHRDSSSAGPAQISRTGPAFDEEDEDEWRIHSVMQPVKARESI
ncbi:hypothetical protein ASPZODRAFT_55272 [Penicilliopsis zonata CBS 506.65]|uniref:Histidine acid phosphatase n=1 Tax=Penicilliopsis zonata CBS 506.65 TaxID=1073090 RepID=A0A1L9SUZ9_9EURO|nr:hypothetical protein ASPZODRAFT_55272 [Penicilliopsis zonata CBS 506.65]OJJ50897.1 hypothetical protein ASPZODRAFT_55272 [Penicilliopsis zonata CBS 506.65]